MYMGGLFKLVEPIHSGWTIVCLQCNKGQYAYSSYPNEDVYVLKY